jgi:hypothetical protein
VTPCEDQLPMRPSELARGRRQRLTRHIHELARSGQYENAEAVISEFRVHEDFDAASHEAGAFRTALNIICDLAKRKRDGDFRIPPRRRRLEQQQPKSPLTAPPRHKEGRLMPPLEVSRSRPMAVGGHAATD